MRKATVGRLDVPLVTRVGTNVVFIDGISESWELQRTCLGIIIEVADQWCKGVILRLKMKRYMSLQIP